MEHIHTEIYRAPIQSVLEVKNKVSEAGRSSASTAEVKSVA